MGFSQAEDVSCTARGGIIHANQGVVRRGKLLHSTQRSPGRQRYVHLRFFRPLSSHSGRPPVPRRSGCSNIAELYFLLHGYHYRAALVTTAYCTYVTVHYYYYYYWTLYVYYITEPIPIQK